VFFGTAYLVCCKLNSRSPPLSPLFPEDLLYPFGLRSLRMPITSVAYLGGTFSSPKCVLDRTLWNVVELAISRGFCVWPSLLFFPVSLVFLLARYAFVLARWRRRLFPRTGGDSFPEDSALELGFEGSLAPWSGLTVSGGQCVWNACPTSVVKIIDSPPGFFPFADEPTGVFSPLGRSFFLAKGQGFDTLLDSLYNLWDALRPPSRSPYWVMSLLGPQFLN